jgi:hypothetical protein
MDTTPSETTMTKLLTAIVAALLTLSAVATSAEARCHHGRGFGFFRAVRHIAFHTPRHVPRRVVVVHRQAAVRVVERVVVEKEVTKPTPVTEEVAEIESENSSITAADEVAEEKTERVEKKVVEKSATKRNQKVAAASGLGCKSFFASVGMTLSVPCDQK